MIASHEDTPHLFNLTMPVGLRLCAPIGWVDAVIAAASWHGSSLADAKANSTGAAAFKFVILSGSEAGLCFNETVFLNSADARASEKMAQFSAFVRCLGVELASFSSPGPCIDACHGKFVRLYVGRSKRHADEDACDLNIRVFKRMPDARRAGAMRSYARIQANPALVTKHDSALAESRLVATPFGMLTAQEIEPRSWLYGRATLRGALSLIIGHGGTGKSVLTIVEALAMTTGKSLLGVAPSAPLRVWAINLEDPFAELARRFAAAALAHGVEEADYAGRLFVSGSETKLCIASSGQAGPQVDEAIVAAFMEEIALRGVDVVIVDPFVSTHHVNENDNMAIDLVATTWARIASLADIAVILVHHARKTGGQEVTVEDGRGAIALINKSRVVRELNTMSKQESETCGIEDRQQYFFVKNGKANMAARNDRKEWYQISSYVLPGSGGGEGFGDSVGVVKRWQFPDTRFDLVPEQLEAVRAAVAAGTSRKDHQAKNYVGKVVAHALGIDPEDKQSMRGLKVLISRWVRDGALVEVEALTDKREIKAFIGLANWEKAVCRT